MYSHLLNSNQLAIKYGVSFGAMQTYLALFPEYTIKLKSFYYYDYGNNNFKTELELFLKSRKEKCKGKNLKWRV